MSVTKKVESTSKLLHEYVALKRVMEECRETFVSHTDAVIEEIKKLGATTVNVIGGRITLRSKKTPMFDVKELEKFLKKKKANLADFQVLSIDMSKITPEFLEEHKLLHLVSETSYDLSKIVGMYGEESTSKLIQYSVVESVSVTLTKDGQSSSKSSS